MSEFLLELSPFLLQRVDLDRQRLPVEIAKAFEHGKLSQQSEAVVQRRSPAFQLRDPGSAGLHSLLQAARLAFQGGDLRFVRPSENKSRAVVQPIPIVLLVALPAGLHLAARRQRSLLAAKLLHGFAAGVVEAAGEVGFQPGVEFGFRPDGELAHERARIELDHGRRAAFAHPIVDQAAAQLRAVHPFRHAGIMIVCHQQGKGIAPQQPLGRAFPTPLLLADLDQLADERHGGLVEPEGSAQAIAHGQHLGRNVGAPLSQGADLLAALDMPVFQLPESDALVRDLVLNLRLLAPHGFAPRDELLPVGEERVGVARREQTGVAGEPAVLLGPRHAFVLDGPLACNFLAETLDAIAAVLRDGALDLVALEPPPGFLLLQRLDAVCEPRQLAVQAVQSLFQQLGFQPGEECTQGVATPAQHLHLGGQRPVLVAIRHQRNEALDLSFGFQHGLVGAPQVVEMPYQGGDPGLHGKGFQHVLAHEIGEIADRLHGDGLIEQIQRLLVADAEPARGTPLRTAESCRAPRPSRSSATAYAGR